MARRGRLEQGRERFVRAMNGRERTLGYELDLNPRAERDRLLREMEEVTFAPFGPMPMTFWPGCSGRSR